MAQTIKNIVIVGGGTAGWMAAAALSKALATQIFDITLVESEDIGTVGVGEATIPAILKFNQFLNIDEATFVRETHATYKLGIEFVDWKRIGDSYFHPFGQCGSEIEGFAFHHFWLAQHRRGHTLNITNYNLETEAAMQGRFGRTVPEPGKPDINYAFQFDAALYARFLSKYSIARGVVRREGRVVSVRQSASTGNVEALQLQDGQIISGDLFLDCTGFRGLLIEETLKCGYTDWSEWLPMNRAVAVPCARTRDPTPFTQATAREAGWQWRIPLQHRTGNGYVFCDRFITEDEAVEKLMSRLDGDPLADPKILRFVTGHRKRFWSHNVIALGLASGFLEPLESTAIHLVQTGIFKLLNLFPKANIEPSVVDQYNRDVLFDYNNIKDFLIAHYKLTQRDDTPFWRWVQSMPIPETLRMRLDMFSKTGNLITREPELFRDPSWLAVLLGQGMMPESYNPAADALDEDDVRLRLGHQRKAVSDRLKTLPAHEDFLRRLVPADVGTSPR